MPKPKSARRESKTLAQFDAAVDEHAGSPQLFAATVRALRECRAQSSVVDERRAELFEVLKERYEFNDRVVGDTDRVLKMTRPGVPRIVRSVPSAVIKKASPTLWEQAKVPTPFVQAVAPANTSRVAVEPLPPVPDRRADLAEVVSRYEVCKERAKELRETEAELVDRLKKIGANNGWDGLPIEFADGWKVSLARMQYSSERLAQIAPETFACLAVDTERCRAATLYVGRAGAVDDTEFDAELGVGL